MKSVRKRLTYANVMSTIAVFLVVRRRAVHWPLGARQKNTVGTKQLKEQCGYGNGEDQERLR